MVARPHRRAYDPETEPARDRWRTPPELLIGIRERFDIVLDLAADAPNVCEDYLTAGDDALTCPWGPRLPAVRNVRDAAWCNPPFSRVAEFVEVLAQRALELRLRVLMLAPSATDTKWWHRAAGLASQVWIYRGRVSFVDPGTGRPVSGNPIGSSLFVFDDGVDRGIPIYRRVDRCSRRIS